MEFGRKSFNSLKYPRITRQKFPIRVKEPNSTPYRNIFEFVNERTVKVGNLVTRKRRKAYFRMTTDFMSCDFCWPLSSCWYFWYPWPRLW